MTEFNGWVQQTGGLWLSAPFYDPNNPQHQIDGPMAVRGTVQTVTSTHGAKVSERGFRSNMALLNSTDPDNRMRAVLYYAAWNRAQIEVCSPITNLDRLDIQNQPLCIGAALGWDTCAFTPDGQVVPAHYTEDVAVIPSQLRPLIRGAKKAGITLPEESLVALLEKLTLESMAKEGIHYRFGEVNPQNTTMMRQLGHNGADMGTNFDSAVKEFHRLPNNLRDFLPMDHEVEIKPIRRGGIPSKTNFIVQWKQGPHDLRFIVTKGQGTTIGKPRVDIRTWHKGPLPNTQILNCVIATAIRMTEAEIIDKEWSREIHGTYPSPIICAPDIGRAEILHTVFKGCKTEIILPADLKAQSIPPPLEIHAHIIGSREIVTGFAEIGATQRVFGGKPMVPGVNVL